MFSVVICDDSEIDRHAIVSALCTLRDEGLQIEVSPFVSGEELARSYQKKHFYDFIILDVCMGAMNGIDTARVIRGYDSQVPIAIVTANIEYALEGYQVHACRYLLKPVDTVKLTDLVRTAYEQKNRLAHPYYIISHDQGITKVHFDDIAYFESHIRRIILHTVTGDEYRFSGKISEVADQLVPFGFIRVHKSFIVNLRHVKNIFKGEITLETGIRIDVSKYRIKEVYGAIMGFTEVQR